MLKKIQWSEEPLSSIQKESNEKFEMKTKLNGGYGAFQPIIFKPSI